MNIILASQSPRRNMLLQAVGFTVDVCPSHVDETPLPGEKAQAMTVRLCRAKAAACPHEDMPVVAADTLVEIDGEALGQPQDLDAAKAMIAKLSGREHRVHTTVCARKGDVYAVETVTTGVRFREITSEEIDVYVRHNDILDKAGAYAIQGGASSFIVGIQGALDNVIGLPVQTTRKLLMQVMESET